MKKPTLHLLYEDESQIRRNCFIAQLYVTLERNFRIDQIPRSRLIDGVSPFPSGALVLSLLKLRNWDRLTPFLAKVTEKSGAFFYDQDPWEAYYAHASRPGAYSRLSSFLNVRSFLVTSGWWARHIVETDGLPVKFVRMGMLPEYCDQGAHYGDRPVEVGFQGTLHANRAEFFDRMKELGVETTFRHSQPYHEFLKSIQDFRIYLHHEMLPDGTPINGIWIKEIEAAARGLFAIRNGDDDEVSYRLDEIPTIFTFEAENEVPGIIDRIRAMSTSELNERMEQSVARIRERDDWNTVVEAIRT